MPEGWVIVTAGNPPEYNDSVREMDIVTLRSGQMYHGRPLLDRHQENLISLNGLEMQQ